MKRILIPALVLTISSSIFAANPVHIGINANPEIRSEASPLLFGSFSEMHGGDLIPGIYEQLIINPSFEPWYTQARDSKTDLLFNVKKFDGVAYPWESRHRAGSPIFSVSKDAFNTDCSQQITVHPGDTASLVQRIALPDYRTISYKVSFFAKCSGNIDLQLFIFNRGGTPSKKITIENLDDNWKKYEITLNVNIAKRRYGGRYGEHNISFNITGDGNVWIDQVLLFPSDCIDGIFNPETVAYFKKYNISCIRWPGGNFTSGYHWKKGVGPTDTRISEPNLAWNGINTNLLGTDEIMRFCSLTGITPIIGVGYGLLEENEAAEWVEYCNGSVATEMGALRARNGHPEPYNVTFWGVGNEVYGDYQLGFTDEESYARGLIPIVRRMKDADRNIKVLASAYGVHNSCRKPRNWTSTVDSIAGKYIDMYDAHLYIHGPREKALKDLNEEEIFRIFAASPLYVGKYLNDYRKDTGSKPLAFLEWGVLPHARDERIPDRSEFSNLLLSACIMNEMLRNCDIVKMGAAHNFSFYVAPQKSHSEPVNCRTELFPRLSLMAGGILAPTDTTGIPGYKVRQNWHDIKSWNKVPELDIASVVKDQYLYISIVNKSIRNSYPLEFEITGAVPQSGTGECFTSAEPYRTVKWANEETRPDITQLKTGKKGKSTVTATVPAMSYTFLRIKLKK